MANLELISCSNCIEESKDQDNTYGILNEEIDKLLIANTNMGNKTIILEKNCGVININDTFYSYPHKLDEYPWNVPNLQGIDFENEIITDNGTVLDKDDLTELPLPEFDDIVIILNIDEFSTNSEIVRYYFNLILKRQPTEEEANKYIERLENGNIL